MALASTPSISCAPRPPPPPPNPRRRPRLRPSTLPTQRPLPKIVALHGEADTAVKFLPTREAVEHLEKLGWSISLRAYPEVGHAIPPKMRRELYLQLQRALDAQQ